MPKHSQPSPSSWTTRWAQQIASQKQSRQTTAQSVLGSDCGRDGNKKPSIRICVDNSPGDMRPRRRRISLWFGHRSSRGAKLNGRSWCECPPRRVRRNRGPESRRRNLARTHSMRMRQPEGADKSLTLQIRERFPRLIIQFILIRFMNQVEINAIAHQPPEAFFEFALYMIAPQPETRRRMSLVLPAPCREELQKLRLHSRHARKQRLGVTPVGQLKSAISRLCVGSERFRLLW